MNFVCALPSEASPLCAQYAMRAVCDTPFRIFESEPATLIVSGIGIAASAAAVGYLAGRGEPDIATTWLNVGIAGHRDLDIGTVVLGDRVRDAADGRCWYPSLLFSPPCATGMVTSHGKPVTDYPPASCCDMEAAGFMSAVTRVAQADLVHVVKIVSDNTHSGIDRIDRSFISDILGASVDTIVAIAAAAQAVAANLPRGAASAPPVEALLGRCHFTVSETAQLRELWRRHTVLGGSETAFVAGIDDCRGAAATLDRIRQTVADLPLRWEGADP